MTQEHLTPGAELPRELATPTLHSSLLKHPHSRPCTPGTQTSEEPIYICQISVGEMKPTVLQKLPKLQPSQRVSAIRRRTGA